MQSLMKTGLASLALVSVSLMAMPGFAADEINVTPGLTAAGKPLALHGADPVALLKKGKEVEGEAKFTGEYEGVNYYFDTQENLDKFKAEPAKYVPQNGGFCTFGVSVGKKFDGDPKFASIVDGKLYVFLNEEIYGLYKKDKEGTISKAAEQWKKIKHTKATDL